MKDQTITYDDDKKGYGIKNNDANHFNDSSDEENMGVIFGNVSNASSIYDMDKFIANNKGHGIAAEYANHLNDVLHGEHPELVGYDNTKNGPDRIVNGVNIQTKYCVSGSKCIKECFDDSGKFKYINSDGTPMQIEVPSDKYDDAVKAMQERINKGAIPGVTDSKDAKKIIKKGCITYKQALNIAKAGTVESITYDSINGVIIASSSFGISAAITYAVLLWNNEDPHDALKIATGVGIKVGGVSFCTAVVSGQLARTGLNGTLISYSEAIVNKLGTKGASFIANAARSGKNIYGAAAMKSAAKMLRSNIITCSASLIIMESVDVINIFRGRISGAQLFKNFTNTTAALAGGTAGWVAGAMAGGAIGSFVPVIGNAAGALIGGLVGAFEAGNISEKTSNSILSHFIEEDADEMIHIIEKEFIAISDDYFLNENETKNIVEELNKKLNGSIFKDMYASNDRQNFAINLLTELTENEVKKRIIITLPTDEEKIIALIDFEKMMDSDISYTETA